MQRSRLEQRRDSLKREDSREWGEENGNLLPPTGRAAASPELRVQAAHLQRSNSGTHLQRANSGSGKLGIAASPRRDRPFSQLRRMVVAVLLMGCVLYGVYLLAVPHDSGYGGSADLGRGFTSAKLQDATDLGMHNTFVGRRSNRQVDVQLADYSRDIKQAADAKAVEAMEATRRGEPIPWLLPVMPASLRANLHTKAVLGGKVPGGNIGTRPQSGSSMPSETLRLAMAADSRTSRAAESLLLAEGHEDDTRALPMATTGDAASALGRKGLPETRGALDGWDLPLPANTTIVYPEDKQPTEDREARLAEEQMTIVRASAANPLSKEVDESQRAKHDELAAWDLPLPANTTIAYPGEEGEVLLQTASRDKVDPDQAAEGGFDPDGGLLGAWGAAKEAEEPKKLADMSAAGTSEAANVVRLEQPGQGLAAAGQLADKEGVLPATDRAAELPEKPVEEAAKERGNISGGNRSAADVLRLLDVAVAKDQALSRGDEARVRTTGGSLSGSKLLDAFLLGTEDLSFPEFDDVEEDVDSGETLLPVDIVDVTDATGQSDTTVEGQAEALQEPEQKPAALAAAEHGMSAAQIRAFFKEDSLTGEDPSLHQEVVETVAAVKPKGFDQDLAREASAGGTVNAAQAAERAADAHAERTGEEGVKAAIVEGLADSGGAASYAERQLQGVRNRAAAQEEGFEEVLAEATTIFDAIQPIRVERLRGDPDFYVKDQGPQEQT